MLVTLKPLDPRNASKGIYHNGHHEPHEDSRRAPIVLYPYTYKVSVIAWDGSEDPTLYSVL